jgi:OOP family OmpA-OmpF porin
MGAIFKTKFVTPVEISFLAVILVIAGGLAYYFGGRIPIGESLKLNALTLNAEMLDNALPTDLLPLPSEVASIKANTELPSWTVAGYAWNGESALIGATGGKSTTKGSLMELNNVNVTVVRQDMADQLMAMQTKFVEQFDAGEKYPSSKEAAAAVMIMGDGAPWYVSTMQASLDDKFGKDKYHVVVVGCVGGASDGEDKLIGPAIWKKDPQTMIGSLISVVPGDGDWVTLINFCFASGLKVNSDFNTYDATAVNIYPSADFDYINSAKELISSQTAGFTVALKEKDENGRLTGKTVDKKIDGCATWTPGDKMVFEALTGFTDVASTADFPNQMWTTLIVVKEWAELNPEKVTGLLQASLTAANQMKLYDEWAVNNAALVSKVFGIEDGTYWYNMFKGQTGTKGGVSYNMGGTSAKNYADVMQYYGLGHDGINRYQAVYNQVSDYLVKLNPNDFNSVVETVIPYEKAVDLRYLKAVKGAISTEEVEIDYTEKKETILAKGQWDITFETGKAVIQPASYGDIDRIYNLLVQAEQTKVTIVGHTDNVGNDAANNKLSDARANAVAEALLAKGIVVKRFQEVAGRGSKEPIADNNTFAGKAANRRVTISFLK